VSRPTSGGHLPPLLGRRHVGPGSLGEGRHALPPWPPRGHQVPALAPGRRRWWQSSATGAGGDGSADDGVGLVHKVEGKRRECLVLGAMAASAASASAEEQLLPPQPPRLALPPPSGVLQRLLSDGQAHLRACSAINVPTNLQAIRDG
jgi:hypothetical protein